MKGGSEKQRRGYVAGEEIDCRLVATFILKQQAGPRQKFALRFLLNFPNKRDVEQTGL